MDAPDGGDDDTGLNGDADEGVRDATMVGEARDRPVERPEGVEVWRLGGEGHGEGGVGRLAVEPGAGETCAGHQVGDGFHRFLEYRG